MTLGRGLILVALLSAFSFDLAHAQGTGTITGLQQWVASSSPSANITQATWGKAIKITGLTTGLCLTLDANKFLTTTSCGTGGGSFAWTPFAWGNSTSTVLGMPGVIITGSSTLSSLGTGGLAVNDGLIYNAATTTFSGGLTYVSGNVTNTLTAGDGLTRTVDDFDLDIPVLVASGGTGLTSFTGNRLFYTNADGSAIAFTATSSLNIGGNAGTATALAANAANCAAGSAAGGVSAAGAAEDCTDYWTEAENTAAGYTNNTGTVTSIATTWPITGGTITTTGTLGYGGLSTSSPISAASGLLYATGVNTLASVSTSSAVSMSITGNAGTVTNGVYTTGAGTVYEVPLTFSTPLVRSANTINWVGLATTSQPASSNLLTSNGGSGVYGTATSTLTASAPLTGSFVQVGSGGALGLDTSGTWSGNAGTATALAANGGNCTAGNYPLGVNALGAVEDCTAISAGSAFPFTPTTNFGVAVNATSTPIWFVAGIMASSTSRIASTTFNINGQILSGDGTEALPSYSFASDPDTGFSHNNGSNVLQVAVAGSSCFQFDASGLRGITTANCARLWAGGSSSGLASSPNISFNNDSDTGIFAGNSNLLGFTTGGVEAARFDSGQLLGLGTTTPKWKLTVASSTGPQLALTDTSLTSTPWTFRSINNNLYIATSSPSDFSTSTVPAIAIDTNGKVTFGANAATCLALTGSADLCDGVDGGGGTSAFEIATTSNIATPQLAYFTQASGRTTLGSVATTTATCTGLISCSAFTALGSSPITITTASGLGSMSGWATSTAYGSQLVLYPLNGTEDVVFGKTGASATTTAPFWWDVSATSTYIGNGGVGTSSMAFSGSSANPSNKWWNVGAYSSTQSGFGSFIIASSSTANDLTTLPILTINQAGNVAFSYGSTTALSSTNLDTTVMKYDRGVVDVAGKCALNVTADLAAATDVSACGSLSVTSDNTTSTSRSFCITGGVEGQILYLFADVVTTSEIELVDGAAGACAGSTGQATYLAGVWPANASQNNDAAVLMYRTTAAGAVADGWFELNRSAN